MGAKGWAVACVVALIMGFVGGALSYHLPFAKLMRQTHTPPSATEKERPEKMRVLAVALVDRAGRMRAFLGEHRGGEWALTFLDSQGKARCIFGVGPEGAPFIDMLGPDQKVIWSAP